MKQGRAKNTCKRCVGLKNFGVCASEKRKKNFYCDVGMRSVLRQIRRLLLLDLDFKTGWARTEESQDVDDRVVSFFRENILLQEDFSSSDCNEQKVLDRHIIQLMDFFLVTRGKKVSKVPRTNCNNKNGKKGSKRAQRDSTSTFAKFGKKIFLEIEDNPVSDDFVNFLTEVYKQDLINGYEEGLQSCREKSFDAVVRLMRGY